MVRNVVSGREPCRSRRDCRAICEPTHKRTPSDSGFVKQIAHILARHRDLRALWIGASIATRVGVANHGPGRCPTCNIAFSGESIGDCSLKCVACNQIEKTWCRGAKGGSKGIITHREMLSVVPKCRDGVAIVIAHGAEGTDIPVVAAQLREAVHQAAVEGKLLVSVVVVLVTGISILAIDAERIGSVGIASEQAGGFQIVNAGCAFLDVLEVNRAVVVRLSVRISAEVMVERNVFLEDHDYVFDWRLREGAATLLCVCWVRWQ